MNPDTLNTIIIVCNIAATAFLLFLIGMLVAMLCTRGNDKHYRAVTMCFVNKRFLMMHSTVAFATLLASGFFLAHPATRSSASTLVIIMHVVTVPLSALIIHTRHFRKPKPARQP